MIKRTARDCQGIEQAWGDEKGITEHQFESLKGIDHLGDLDMEG
jgi:hypothetical protein